MKKVAIVGCSDSKHLAPFDDTSFEIWGVNNLFPQLPRANRWFEIHHLSKEGDKFLRRGSLDFRGQKVSDYIRELGAWTKEKNCRVYMQKIWEEIPTSTPYPLKEITSMFGNYFTNTVSYEIALAIAEGFEEIHVYGVDMAVDTEYHHQRPSCEYFLGLALGKGIKVHIPAEADLLKSRFLYGFQEPEIQAWNKKCMNISKSMAEKRAKLEGESRMKEAQINQYIGAQQAIKELNKIWG